MSRAGTTSSFRTVAAVSRFSFRRRARDVLFAFEVEAERWRCISEAQG
jgi:hypothetical protein